jgi:hypothetical protein
MCPTLNAGGVCSLQGLGYASNPHITEAKTIDPLHRVWVTPTMMLVVPTMALGKKKSGGEGTGRHDPPTMQDDGCHTRIQNPGVDIITKCAWTKSYTYDESWYINECHIFTI